VIDLELGEEVSRPGFRSINMPESQVTSTEKRYRAQITGKKTRNCHELKFICSLNARNKSLEL
jgi:hypothetical protein